MISDIPDSFLSRTGRTNKETVKERDNRVANIVLYFLEHSACNIPDMDGNTLLHHAAKRGLNKTVSLLMKRGWNAFDRDKDENTALHLALISREYSSFAKKLDFYIMNCFSCTHLFDDEGNNLYS